MIAGINKGNDNTAIWTLTANRHNVELSRKAGPLTPEQTAVETDRK